MSVFAALRPNDQDFPLLIHVLGAATLVSGLLTSTTLLAFARGDGRFLRLGYWSLLALALPGWIVMRLGAQWIFNEQGWDDVDEDQLPAWIDLGFIFADLGGLILLVTLILGGVGVYRMRAGKGAGLLKGTLVLALILLAAYVVAAWAMAGKPD
jgi:hypothetical protein